MYKRDDPYGLKTAVHRSGSMPESAKKALSVTDVEIARLQELYLTD